MKLRKMKKGFTIVELVIVIAVIGVLTAILIPTFVNLTARANKASDNSLVANLNTALRTQEGEDGSKNPTMHDAVLDLYKQGYNLSQLVTKSKDKLLWNMSENQFELESDSSEGANLWKIYQSSAEIAAETKGFSAYAGHLWNEETDKTVAVSAGFDAGYVGTITNVSYASTKGQTVVIRTVNSELEIDALPDTVKHYGHAEAVDIEKIAGASYHEYGTVSYLEIKRGRVVAENNGVIETVYVTGTSVEVKKESGGAVNLAYAASEEIAAAVSTASIPVVATTEDVSSFVARTSTAGYASLAEAVDGAAAGDTVVLLKDAPIADVIITKSLVLDGKGYNVIGTGLNSPKNKQKGYSGFNIEGNGSAMNVIFKDMTITQTGNLAVINIDSNDGNNNINLTVSGVKMSEFYGYGIRANRGRFSIDNCLIDCTSSPRSTRNGINVLVNTGNRVVGSVTNTKICGAYKEGKWDDSGICVVGGCDLTVDKCEITECSIGVSFWMLSSSVGNQNATITNTKISASIPVYIDDYGFAANFNITLGRGNNMRSTDGMAVYGHYESTNTLALSIDTANSQFSDDWVAVIYIHDPDNPDADEDGDVFDAENSVYIGE